MTTTTTTRNFGLIAVFPDAAALQGALAACHAAGVPADELTVLGPGSATVPGAEPAAESVAALAEAIEPADREAALGAVAGAYAGLWGSLLLLAVPGVGMAVAAGGAAALMAEALTTATVGASLGTLVGAIGHERHAARHRAIFQEALDRGGWLLVVHADEAGYERASGAVARCRPSHLDHFLA